MNHSHDTADIAKSIPHSLTEDIFALLVGSLVLSFGDELIKQVGGLTGGIAGLALLVHYLTGIKFGTAFFLLNLPFYWLAFRRIGRIFFIKTFCAILMVSVFIDQHPRFIDITHLNPYYAMIFSNVLIGLGIVVLFRHRASVGGLTIIALYVQDRFNIRAGHVLMAFDGIIMLSSLFLVSLPLFASSIIGVLIANLLIAMNHRPSRYNA